MVLPTEQVCREELVKRGRGLGLHPGSAFGGRKDTFSWERDH